MVACHCILRQSRSKKSANGQEIIKSLMKNRTYMITVDQCAPTISLYFGDGLYLVKSGTVLQLGHRTGVLRVLKALQSENMCVFVYPAKQLDKSRNYRLPLKHHVSSS